MVTANPGSIWTIGHSSRPISEFLALLEPAHIAALADVRRHAGSRAHPHFNPGPLAEALSAEGIEYAPFPELGGRRTPNADSRNTVWRNRSFRGYADYMETSEYRAGIDRLLIVAAEKRTVVLCAEALWWQCHRALIADDLKARGITISHIMGAGKPVEHPYTSAAQLVDGKLVYGAGTGPA
ncbi:MAG: DUF488 domain-containing protein [Gammaproteobacteria bacterium]|nr:DUF488 domain-containing protein [Gammaproteobacteria bacterium]